MLDFSWSELALIGVVLTLLTACAKRDKGYVEDSDTEMATAITKAQETLPQFWQVFDTREHGESDFILVVRITDKGRLEHFVITDFERRDGKKKMFLVTNVLDQKALTEKSAGVLYEMRWGVEVFYRSLKQTLEKRRMLSRTPEAAKCELTWAVFGLWLLGLMTASEILARGGDPLAWSAAKARQRVRRSMRRALTRRHADRGLGRDLSIASSGAGSAGTCGYGKDEKFGVRDIAENPPNGSTPVERLRPTQPVYRRSGTAVGGSAQRLMYGAINVVNPQGFFQKPPDSLALTMAPIIRRPCHHDGRNPLRLEHGHIEIAARSIGQMQIHQGRIRSKILHHRPGLRQRAAG